MKPSILAFLLSCPILACDGADEAGDPLEGDTLSALESLATSEVAVDSARADIVDASGVGIGAVILTGSGDGVELNGALIGLPPGEHGFHIHQTGSCEPPISESAGSHYAPGGSPHGFDASGGPHAGDLRNLVVADDSTATVDQTNEQVSLEGGAAELLDDDGSALVIHAGPDDYSSQPSGGSGDPIACGVIEG
ncbi:superoxide dismutase family protein [soil metagenome]